MFSRNFKKLFSIHPTLEGEVGSLLCFRFRFFLLFWKAILLEYYLGENKSSVSNIQNLCVVFIHIDIKMYYNQMIRITMCRNVAVFTNVLRLTETGGQVQKTKGEGNNFYLTKHLLAEVWFGLKGFPTIFIFTGSGRAYLPARYLSPIYQLTEWEDSHTTDFPSLYVASTRCDQQRSVPNSHLS